MIVTVTTNPAVDHMLFVDGMKLHDSNRVQQVDRDAGGKGINASRVIHNLGGKTLATGFLGGGTGAYIRHVLSEEGVAHHFSRTAGETRINFSIEDGSNLPPTCFNEPGPDVTDEEVDSLVSFLGEHLHPGGWLLAAGSLPPGLSPEFFKQLGELAKNRYALFAIDADSDCLRHGLEAGPAFLKPNVKEAQRLLGRELNCLDDLLRAAIDIRELASSSPIVVISRGADGAVMADSHGLWIGETPRVDVRSTVGSGDSMVGAMLFALDRGQPNSVALALGMAAGAATAAKSGAGLASKADISRLLFDAQVAPSERETFRQAN